MQGSAHRCTVEAVLFRWCCHPGPAIRAGLIMPGLAHRLEILPIKCAVLVHCEVLRKTRRELTAGRSAVTPARSVRAELPWHCAAADLRTHDGGLLAFVPQRDLRRGQPGLLDHGSHVRGAGRAEAVDVVGEPA